MNNFYLLVPPISEEGYAVPERNQHTTVKSSASNNNLTTNVGDKLLVMHSKGPDYEGIIPNIAKIVQVNRQVGTLTLETEKTYNKKVPIDAVRMLLKRPLGVGMTQLTQAEFDAIISQMGDILLDERALLELIKHYIAAKGYYFDDETIYNYHICLKTRPFVILAGLSGTGKSKLSQLYAEALGHKVQNKRYLRLAVRPSWNDDRFLLGYLNSITGEYVTEPAVDFIIRAEEDRDNLYFFCLDG